MFLPKEVLLEVETWVTYDPQTMLILHHEDTWSNKVCAACALGEEARMQDVCRV